MNYYTIDLERCKARGPYTASQLLELREIRALPDLTPVAVEGAASWSTLGDLLHLLREEFQHEVHAVLKTAPMPPPVFDRLLNEDGCLSRSSSAPVRAESAIAKSSPGR